MLSPQENAQRKKHQVLKVLNIDGGAAQQGAKGRHGKLMQFAQKIAQKINETFALFAQKAYLCSL